MSHLLMALPGKLGKIANMEGNVVERLFDSVSEVKDMVQGIDKKISSEMAAYQQRLMDSEEKVRQLFTFHNQIVETLSDQKQSLIIQSGQFEKQFSNGLNRIERVYDEKIQVLENRISDNKKADDEHRSNQRTLLKAFAVAGGTITVLLAVLSFFAQYVFKLDG